MSRVSMQIPKVFTMRLLELHIGLNTAQPENGTSASAAGWLRSHLLGEPDDKIRYLGRCRPGRIRARQPLHRAGGHPEPRQVRAVLPERQLPELWCGQPLRAALSAAGLSGSGVSPRRTLA